MLKKSIIVKSIDGSNILNTGNYQSRGKSIIIYRHNGHAWSDISFPKTKEVTYVGDPWDIIKDIYKTTAVWYPGNDEHTFMSQNGTLYRRLEDDERIQERCQELGVEDAMTLSSAIFAAARQKNNWEYSKYAEIEHACVEHGHGGLWKVEYDKEKYLSLDMKHCYPASFKGLGDCKPYFEKYGHPHGQFFKVSLQESYDLPLNGFVRIGTWEFPSSMHPIIPAWYGKHILDKQWLPVPY